MPQFDASGIVEGLECKLKPFADFDGVIPEPSDKQIGEFLIALKRVQAEGSEKLGVGAGVDITDPQQVSKALEALNAGDFVKITDEMAGIHADLCSGSPSKAQILAVPLRRRQHFYTWLQQEVLSPEAAPGAGNAQVSSLSLRAAGSSSISPAGT